MPMNDENEERGALVLRQGGPVYGVRPDRGAGLGCFHVRGLGDQGGLATQKVLGQDRYCLLS